MRLPAVRIRFVRVAARACLSPAGMLLTALILQLNLLFTPSAHCQIVRIADVPAGVNVTNDARTKAGDIFTERCATCHGADGHGNGPAAVNLKPKPLDFHSSSWQRSVTDETITKAIVFGGKAVGKSGQMAPNPDLENEPSIVAALVEKIRKFGK